MKIAPAQVRAMPPEDFISCVAFLGLQDDEAKTAEKEA